MIEKCLQTRESSQNDYILSIKHINSGFICVIFIRVIILIHFPLESVGLVCPLHTHHQVTFESSKNPVVAEWQQNRLLFGYVDADDATVNYHNSYGV